MRVMLDANVLLDCLVIEANGQPRAGKAASDQLLNLCDTGVHRGLVAWHTLPIVACYHGRQHSPQDTAAMMDSLMAGNHGNHPSMSIRHWLSLGRHIPGANGARGGKRAETLLRRGIMDVAFAFCTPTPLSQCGAARAEAGIVDDDSVAPCGRARESGKAQWVLSHV